MQDIIDNIYAEQWPDPAVLKAQALPLASLCPASGLIDARESARRITVH